MTKDCVLNLLILLLIIVLIFSITRYIKNKKIKNVNNVNNFFNSPTPTITPMVTPTVSPINNIIATFKEYTPFDVKETTVLYPIDNNTINDQPVEEDLSNNYEYVPDENVTIIEENKETENTKDNFNYSKTFSDDFQGFDSNEMYLPV